MKNEAAFYRKWRKEMMTRGAVVWKVQDAVNPGLPDAIIRFGPSTYFVELKYVPNWPKRAATKVRVKVTANQMVRLKEWSYAWVLLGVENHLFLFDPHVIQSYFDKVSDGYALNRTDLEQTMMGAKTFMAQLEDGTAAFEGDLGVLQQLGSAMVDFDLFFEILPGTKAPSEVQDLNDFEVGDISSIPE